MRGQRGLEVVPVAVGRRGPVVDALAAHVDGGPGDGQVGLVVADGALDAVLVVRVGDARSLQGLRGGQSTGARASECGSHPLTELPGGLADVRDAAVHHGELALEAADHPAAHIDEHEARLARREGRHGVDDHLRAVR